MICVVVQVSLDKMLAFEVERKKYIHIDVLYEDLGQNSL